MIIIASPLTQHDIVRYNIRLDWWSFKIELSIHVHFLHVFDYAIIWVLMISYEFAQSKMYVRIRRDCTRTQTQHASTDVDYHYWILGIF